MEEKKKRKNKKEKILDVLIVIVAIVTVGLTFFLINIPFLFDFKTAPVVGKVFMIIGSVVALIGLTFAWLFMIKINHKDLKVSLFFFSCYYLYYLLAYFDHHIWGSIVYVMIVLFAFSTTHTTYEFVAKFTGIFKGDKIAMFVMSGSILLLSLSMIKETGIDPIFIKIATGILYALSIPCFIKITLLSQNKDLKKNLIIWLMLGIVLGAGIIISFPYYVKWCGLQEEEFMIFVSVYSALVGGGLTLVGVAWTIKQSEKHRKEDRDQLELDRKEEERKKVIPFVSMAKYTPTGSSLNIKWICLNNYEQECKRDDCYGITVNGFAVKNISNYPFIIYGISLNGVMLEYETALVLEKNGEINLEITGNRMIKSEEMVKDLYLILCDIFDNRYKVPCVCSYKMGGVRVDNMRNSFIYKIEQVAFPVLTER